MTDRPPFRVGIVGLGVMGRNHARVIDSSEESLVDLLWDPAPSDEFAHDDRMTSSLEQVIDSRPDYVVVASPSSTHEDIATQLVSAGVPVLIEKPVANTSAGALRLLSAVTSSGVPAAVGHIERHNPAVVEAHRRVLQGQLGRILQISTVREGPYPGRIQDAGVLVDLATHDLNLIEWIGQSQITHLSGQKMSCRSKEVEDLAVASGRTSSGILVQLSTNWLSPQKSRMLVIHGERGQLRCSLLTQDLEFQANGQAEGMWDSLDNFRGVQQGDVIRYAFPRPEPLVMEHKAFQDLLLGRPSPSVTVAEGVRAVLLAEFLSIPQAAEVPIWHASSLQVLQSQGG